MPKRPGSTNYSIEELMLLLTIVADTLPLGSDEWERIAMQYNLRKRTGWSDRDAESLKRKFKQMHQTRKPTGKSEMPYYIRRAKEVKIAIDEKCSVTTMDDSPTPEAPASTTVNSAGSNNESSELQSDQLSGIDVATTALQFTLEDFGVVASNLTDSIDNDFASTASRLGSYSPLSDDEPHSSRIAAPSELSCTRQPEPQHTSLARLQCKASATRGLAPIKKKKKVLAKSSDRLGGHDLSVGVPFNSELNKRTATDADLETDEASFSKTRRIRANRKTQELSNRFSALEASCDKENNLFTMLLMMREDNERRLEQRHAVEDERRREERREEEARRRDERELQELRLRQEREDARSRHEHLLLLLSDRHKP